MDNQADTPPPRIRRLQLHPGQRAFVVGDIHGAFALVDEALELVEFRPEQDLLLSVGDLIDRGAESAQVVDFLARPYVHAVLGNHEETLLRAHAGPQPDLKLLTLMMESYGTEWWLRTSKERQRQVLQALSPLPVILELTTPTGLVGIVHADIPSGMSWRAFAMAVERGHSLSLATALQGRTRSNRDLEEQIPHVDRLYTGHTIQPRARVLGNVGFIDTGAVFRTLQADSAHHLTLVDAQAPLQCLEAPPLIERDRVRVYG